ncbi:hypothetical protein D3C80_1841150 [compost metagenome]
MLLGQGVAENSAFRVGQRSVDHGAYCTACADGSRYDTWLDGAYAEIGEHAVAGSHNEGR